MLTLKYKTYKGLPLHPDAKKIRQIVFIDEQKVSDALEWDEEDNISEHLVVYNKQKAIANARFYLLSNKAILGRMAVLADYRGQGVGLYLLKESLTLIKQKNISKVMIHAQELVIPFYQKVGFMAEGKTFFEANIPHRKMCLTLNN